MMNSKDLQSFKNYILHALNLLIINKYKNPKDFKSFRFYNYLNFSYLQNGLKIEKLGHSFDKLVFVKRILLINLTLEPALPDIIFAIDKS